jgi:hypothetical protein
MNTGWARHLVGLQLVLAIAVSPAVSLAQVSAPTEADKQAVPLQFRPEDQKNGAVTSFAPRGTPAGYTPNPDVRDFSGSYVNDSGAPPGGPRGPGGAGPPPSGPPAGAPPGGLKPNAQSCIPSFDGGAYATHIISSPGRLTVVGEENHRIRRIYIDGHHSLNVRDTYGGDSVGQWQGNTLIVDTIAIRGSPSLHLVERWTRLANGSIEIVTTREGLTGGAPEPETSTLVWRPDLSFLENICEDFGEAFGAGYGAPQN